LNQVKTKIEAGLGGKEKGGTTRDRGGANCHQQNQGGKTKRKDKKNGKPPKQNATKRVGANPVKPQHRTPEKKAVTKRLWW